MDEILDLLKQQQKTEQPPVLPPNIHYYGDRVRRLYFLAAAIMLVMLPFVTNIMAVPIFISIVAILALDFLAGLTNPKQLWVNLVNTGIAAVGLYVFESAAVKSLANYWSFVFLADQTLAIIFLVAIYYETKTLRGMLLK